MHQEFRVCSFWKVLLTNPITERRWYAHAIVSDEDIGPTLSERLHLFMINSTHRSHRAENLRRIIKSSGRRALLTDAEAWSRIEARHRDRAYACGTAFYYLRTCGKKRGIGDGKRANAKVANRDVPEWRLGMPRWPLPITRKPPPA